MNTLQLEIYRDLVRIRKHTPEEIGVLLQTQSAGITPGELAKMCQTANIRRGKIVQIANAFITEPSAIEPFVIGFSDAYLGMTTNMIIVLFRKYLKGEKRTIAIRTIKKMERIA